MRTPALILAGAVLLLLAPLAAADDTFACHSWETHEDVGVATLALSHDDGAVYFATSDAYVVSDGLPNDEFLFSFWLYQESNSEPGLQRSDERCSERDASEADAFCFC